MGKTPSLIHQAIRRLDSLMAIGVSRYAAKEEARSQAAAAGESMPWTVTDGKIHSYSARSSYQHHTVKFLKWARDIQKVQHLQQIDARAGELVSRYLLEQIASGKSPYTVAGYRAALRTFFGDRALASDVRLPTRAREGIHRSRGAAVRDTQFQPANHQPLITFLRGCGLRRSEVRDLRVGDIIDRGDHLEIHVKNGKGGRGRDVPVRPGYADMTRNLAAGRQGFEKIFPSIPSRLDVHSYRREFAQGMYQEISGRDLPPAQGKLKPSDYDRAAVYLVSRALGHNRMDVVLTHYLR